MFSNFNFRKISFMSGTALFTVLGGFSVISLTLKNHIKFEDSSYKNVYILFTFGIFSVGLGCLIISTIAPRVLFRILQPITDKLLKTALEFESSTKEISNLSSQTSNTTQQQLAEIKQTASRLQQMQRVVKQNAEEAIKSKNLVLTSKSEAEEGQTAIQQMVIFIDDLNHSQNNIMNEISHQNEDLSGIIKIINEINEKTKVINDIVFQTKLLSFNASVEAARAGEHGKGFSVVAQEIGNLAQMSGSASQQISNLLVGSVKKVEGIISTSTSRIENLVSQGREKIQNGSSQAKKCEEILSRLAEKVQSVAVTTEEISLAAQTQASDIDGINSSAQELENSSQSSYMASQNTFSSAERLFASSKDLRIEAENLNNIFNFNMSQNPDRVSQKKSYVPEKKSDKKETPVKKEKHENQKLMNSVSLKAVNKVIPITIAKQIHLEKKPQKMVVKTPTRSTKPTKPAEIFKLKKTGPSSEMTEETKVAGVKVPHSNDPRFEDV